MSNSKFALLGFILITSLTLTSLQGAFAYHNSDYGFSFSPPDGWSSVDVSGVIVAYRDPNAATTGASINVVTEETRGTLLQYATASKSYVSSTFNNYNLVSEGSLIINGLDCYILISTWTQSGIDFKAQQVLFLENDRAFVISAIAYTSQYGDAIAYMLPSIQSFAIDGLSDSQESVSPSIIQNTQTSDGANLVAIAAILAVVIIAIIAIIATVSLRKRQRPDNKSPSVVHNQPPSPPVVNANYNTDTSKFCRHCGVPIKADSAFCDSCGQKLG